MTPITWHTMLQTEALGSIVLVFASLVFCTSSASLEGSVIHMVIHMACMVSAWFLRDI